MSKQLSICEMFSSIQGEGMLAGRRQIFVRLTDCNLDCAYCDTIYQKGAVCSLESAPGSNVYVETGQSFSLNDFIVLLKSWCSAMPGVHHSISFTGGEPLLSADTLAVWLPEVAKILPLHLETNGTLSNELERVAPYFDYISMDMKLPSVAACSQPLWDLHLRFLQKAMSSKVSVKLVVGQLTDKDEIINACHIIAAVDKKIPLYIQPMTHPDGTVGITAVHLLSLQETAAKLLPDVSVIPQMHKLLGGLVIIEDMTMPEFKAGLDRSRTVLIPFGSVEEHGQHLPLSTDTIEAYEVAKKASKQVPFFIAPPVHYGNCRSTACHPGTISITTSTLKSLFRDIVSSLRSHGIKNFIALSGHAGGAHRMALQEAGEELIAEFSDIEIAVVTEFDLARDEGRGLIVTPGDSHAGEIETSRIMHSHPHLVKGTSPEEYPAFPSGLLVRDKRKYWPGGVWGDPGQASAEKGARLEELVAGKLVALVIKIETLRNE